MNVGASATAAELSADPYPIYRSLRDEGPCVYLAAANRYVITRWDDVFALDANPAVTAREENSLMTRAMGLTMLRTDGDEHERLRLASRATLGGRSFLEHWNGPITAVAEDLLDAIVPREGGDLVADFAAPFAARTLKLILGIPDVDDDDLDRASQALIDGIGNYADDQEVWARCTWANVLIDAALERSWGKAEEGTVLHSMIDSGKMQKQEIAANIKLFISGGLNEPRDVISSAIWALLRDKEQLALVREDPALLSAAAEETLRWLSPIGMYPRQVQEETVVGGIALPAGSRLGVVLASANRDERHWEDPDRFDVRRDTRGQLAFSRGPHVCLGAFIARHSIGKIALPLIFERLPELRLADDFRPELVGWVFRGLRRLDVRW